MSCRKFPSERNCTKLVYNGFVYYKAGKNSWKCVEKGRTDCRARLVVNPTRLEIKVTGKIHNHKSNEDEELKKSHNHTDREITKTIIEFEDQFDGLRQADKADKDGKVVAQKFDGILQALNHYYNLPDNFESTLFMIKKANIKDQSPISKQAMAIFECFTLPEMQELFKNNFYGVYSTDSSLFKCSNPVYYHCYQLMETYKIYRNYNIIPAHLENLVSERNFRKDIDWFLDHVCASLQEMKFVRYFFPRTCLSFLVHIPYTRVCECGMNCNDEPIHSITNFAIKLGYIPAVPYSRQAEFWFEQGLICRIGRVRTPKFFRQYYYYTHLPMRVGHLRLDCVCGQVFEKNATHGTFNWMAVNGLINREKYDLTKKATCPANNLLSIFDFLQFFVDETDLFETCVDGKMEYGKLYFSYCVRSNVDMQNSIICQTKGRLVYGMSTFGGMSQQRHFLYKGNQQAVQRILDNLERNQLPIDFSWSRVAGPSTSRQFFQT